jgi:hypothetical protein
VHGDPHTIQALVVGFGTGIAVALVSTGIAMVALARGSFWPRLPQNRRIPLPLMGVAFANALLFGWTLVGLVLGALLLKAETARPAPGLGSPNQAFTLGVIALAVLGCGMFAIVRGRLPWPVWSGALVALALFGWALPYLARA